MIPFLTLLLLWFASPVLAAPPAGLSAQSMDLMVKPEYDQSDVLVIYDAQLVNNSTSSYSGDVVFRVPKGINLGQTCEINQKGDHLCQLARTEDQGDYQLVRWSVGRDLGPGESYHAYMEFYYNPIQKKEGRKFIEYEYYPVMPVGQLELTVVQPLRSTDFQASPAPQATSQVVLDGTQFTAHSYQFKNLTGDRPVKVSFSYSKPDDRPSVAKKVAQGTAPGGGTSPGKKMDPALLGLAVILAGVLGFFLYQASGSRQRATAGTPTRARGKEARSVKSAPERGGDHVDERKRARQMLLQGQISEETYKQILRDLDQEKGRRR